MSIKPILFNTDMVRAILDGRKTVTRRLVKPQPTSKMFTGVCTDSTARNDKSVGQWFWGDKPGKLEEGARPPYRPGDILYVRETWQFIDFTGENDGYVFKASENGNDWEENSEEWKWCPSIHMPKEAARIWLKVTNVRVERLQNITGDQAIMEGTKEEFPPLAQDEFRNIWDSTVDKKQSEQYGWEANPWVWVIKFERCEKPQEV